jgi:hypothetical protein
VGGRRSRHRLAEREYRGDGREEKGENNSTHATSGIALHDYSSAAPSLEERVTGSREMDERIVYPFTISGREAIKLNG